jgi:hypothetical protein
MSFGLVVFWQQPSRVSCRSQNHAKAACKAVYLRSLLLPGIGVNFPPTNDAIKLSWRHALPSTVLLGGHDLPNTDTEFIDLA